MRASDAMIEFRRSVIRAAHRAMVEGRNPVDLLSSYQGEARDVAREAVVVAMRDGCARVAADAAFLRSMNGRLA